MANTTAVTPLPPGPGGSTKSGHWAILPAAFSAAECEDLIAIFEQLEAAKGGLVAGRFDTKIRQSALVWLSDEPAYTWVQTRIAQVVAEANRTTFKYALDGFDEQLQLAAYGPGHYYDWHIDRGQGAVAGRRKLTISVQLTHPDLYAGGELELNATGRPVQLPRTQGTAAVFAAHTIHRVAPVGSGMRYSLVAWVHGPDFV